MGDTKIQWTDRTWNPVRGCSRVSEGCRNCYAERVAARFSSGPEVGIPGPFAGFAEMRDGAPHWTGSVELVESKLTEPLRWRKPSRVFVNSMSDLFHEALPDEAIDRVFAVMALAPQHTFQVLTKRPERMRDYFADVQARATAILLAGDALPFPPMHRRVGSYAVPLPNVWLGVSVEDQATADERIPKLLSTPAAVRFVSYEPALGPVDFERVPLPDAYLRMNGVTGCLQPIAEKESEPDDYIYFMRKDMKLNWIIVGGESGPGARPFDIAWARSTIAQCKAAGVACFVKQLGSYAILDRRYDRSVSGWTRWLRDRKGGDTSEWPEDMRVREFPA